MGCKEGEPAPQELGACGGTFIAPACGKKCDDLSRFFNKKAGNNLPLLSVLWLVVVF